MSAEKMQAMINSIKDSFSQIGSKMELEGLMKLYLVAVMRNDAKSAEDIRAKIHDAIDRQLDASVEVMARTNSALNELKNLKP